MDTLEKVYSRSKKVSEDDDDLVRDALRRFDECYEADLQNREEALDDLEFLVGEQWPDNVKSSREGDNRPILTINRMPQFLRQVTGDIRRTNPAIRVMPADGAADKDIAEIYTGLVRHIEHQSDATSVYEQAAESAAACGVGWFRVTTDYRTGDTFEQEIYIEPIRNPLAVHVDPEAKDPTRKDAEYMFVVDRMPNEAFDEAYPDKRRIDWQGKGQPEYLRHWFDRDSTLVAEYFCKKKETKRLGLTMDGQTVDMDEQPELLDKLEIVSERELEVDKIVWYKLSGAEILEGPVEWAGQYIPVICVPGEEVHIGERVIRSSVIRYAKDAQRLYNYARSTMAEIIALQPKAPHYVTPKQIEGFEDLWKNAHKTNYPFLPYNPDDEAPGVPQRVQPPVPSPALMTEIQLAADDMQATTGIYDAGLGQRSNETSGVAIKQRQLESDISTSIYVDNLSRAIGQCGRIIVDLIPKIYDTQRQVRILGEDATEAIETINMPVIMGGEIVLVNDLSRGRYDVRITTGPSYSTMRAEAAEMLVQFAQAFPPAAPALMDMAAKSQDWPEADKLAERLKRMVPMEMLTLEERQERMQEMQNDPMAQQPQQPPPEVIEAQAKAQSEQAKLELEAQKLQQQGAIEAEKLQLERMRTEAEIMFKRSQAAPQAPQGQSDPLAQTRMDLEARKLAIEARKMEIDLYESEAARQQSAAERQSQTDELLVQMGMPPGMTPEQVNAEQGRVMEALSALAQVQAQMAQMQAAQGEAMMSKMDRLEQVMTAPTKIDVQRDASGRVQGATKSVDMQGIE